MMWQWCASWWCQPSRKGTWALLYPVKRNWLPWWSSSSNPSDPHEGNWVVRLISASLASSFASRLVVVVAPAAASSSSSEKNIFLVFVFSSLRREEDSSFTKSSSQLTRSPEPVVTSITWGAHLKLHTGRRRRKKKKRCEGWKKKKDDYTNNDCVPRVQEQHDIYLWW